MNNPFVYQNSEIEVTYRSSCYQMGSFVRSRGQVFGAGFHKIKLRNREFRNMTIASFRIFWSGS